MKHYDILRINILPTGKINFNSKFMKQIKSPYVGIYLKKDGSEFLINPLDANEKLAFGLPKSGSITLPELTRRLTQMGVKLPVLYDIKWDEENDIWVALIQKRTDIEKTISKNRKNIKQSVPKLEDLI